jgi:hypothetical protein
MFVIRERLYVHPVDSNILLLSMAILTYCLTSSFKCLIKTRVLAIFVAYIVDVS